jgi:hypothetical protein
MKEDEIKRPFSIVKKIAPETEPSELKPDENIRDAQYRFV